MKRYITIIAMMALPLALGAQSVTDAINIGTNYYYGTARTMAMGNAFTAVGGDLGSIGINPAGSGVAGYSQFTITPGLVISNGGGSYAPSYQSNPEYGAESSSSETRLYIPNLGASFVFNTGNESGVRSYHFGITMNATNFYDDFNSVSGQDRNSSLTGSRAYWANNGANSSGDQLDPKCLSDLDNAFDNYYWNQVTAYHGGLINYDPQTKQYFGSAETQTSPGKYGVPGTLDQTMSTSTRGMKWDIVLNFALNFDNCFYVGLNLGLPVSRYNYSEYLSEKAVNSEDFPVTPSYWDKKTEEFVTRTPTQYKGSDYSYTYSSSFSGVYGKFGMIWLPNESVRLGAAVQTPVAYTISQRYSVESSSSFKDSKQDANSYVNSNLESFRLNGPWEFNLGAAVTIGTSALLSVDYELTDFSHMKYSSTRAAWTGSAYDEVNSLITDLCGKSHQIRAGAEVNVLPFLALRAGYNLTTSAEKDTKANVMSYGLGAGYKSKGAFFADLGVRLTTYPTTVYSLYQTYIFDGDDVKYYAPEERLFRRLWNVSLTFGWRF